MKTKFYFILSGILFPLFINAQMCLMPCEKTMYPQTSNQSLSKNTPSALLPSSLSGYYREDFEGATFPPSGWQVIDILNPAYTWQATNGFPYNGAQSAFIGYHAAAGEDWLILPQFTVAAGDSFSFQLALQFTGSAPDSTIILVSTTDSSLSSFTSVLATLVEGDNYPTISITYQYYSFDLSAYAGSEIYVAICNKNTYGDGVLIDRVEIGTRPAINASLLSVDLDKCVPTSTAIAPTAIVTNDGNSMQSFPVTMSISGGYSSVKNATNVAPGSSQLIIFDPWTTPGIPADETVSVQIQLAGDGYPADDSLSFPIKLLEPFTNFGWTLKAPISPAKFGIPLASINTNDTSYLFALGGNLGGGNFTSASRKYLPYSNSWTGIPNMPVAAAYACGASYNNKIFVIGGFSTLGSLTNSNRIYDLATNTWSLGTPIPNAIAYNAIGVYQDSLFYYIGGINGFTYHNGVQIYNAASDTWTFGSNLPVGLSTMAGGISGNKIVVSGGFNFNGLQSSTYVGEIDPSNPSNITWTVVDDYPAGACAGLAGGASLETSSGLVIFTGGALNNLQPLLSSKYTLAYDVNLNQWKIGPNKPFPANNLMNLTAVVDNGNLYMVSVGGWGSSMVMNSNEWLNMGPYVIPTGVSSGIPKNASFTCYPNPFVNVTSIKFSLTKSSVVRAVISDVLGQEVEELCNKNLQEGIQHLQWDAAKYTNGIYFCKLIVDGVETAKKLVKH